MAQPGQQVLAGAQQLRHQGDGGPGESRRRAHGPGASVVVHRQPTGIRAPATVPILAYEGRYYARRCRARAPPPSVPLSTRGGVGIVVDIARVQRSRARLGSMQDRLLWRWVRRSQGGTECLIATVSRVQRSQRGSITSIAACRWRTPAESGRSGVGAARPLTDNAEGEDCEQSGQIIVGVGRHHHDPVAGGAGRSR